MFRPGTFAIFPDGIRLTNDEALAVLYALDDAKAAARNARERRDAEAAILLITRKLWDELADVLEMNGDDDG